MAYLVCKLLLFVLRKISQKASQNLVNIIVNIAIFWNVQVRVLWQKSYLFRGKLSRNLQVQIGV